MVTLPGTPLDSSLRLKLEGYRFISNRCDREGTDVFETRLLLQRTICMRGHEAARLFYDEAKFTRVDAAPAMLEHTLIGEGGVHGYDGEPHRHRKATFLDILAPQDVERLVNISDLWFERYVDLWEAEHSIVLFEQLREILCRAVFEWAGVPLEEDKVAERTRDLTDMINSPASVGIMQVRGQLARRRAESWAEQLIRQSRRDNAFPAVNAVSAWANHRELDGELLPERVAAVELLNILRPVVAVARFIVFEAMALWSYPRIREALVSGELQPAWVADEVRRFYPFFPFVAARVRETFEWNGQVFEQGTRTVLDLYGTNHDARLWPRPEEFNPMRFRQAADAYALIPQGGADAASHHRCPGEPATLALMERALTWLTERIAYDIPAQDLSLNLAHIPAEPPSGFVMANVRRR